MSVDWEYGMCPLDTEPERFGLFEGLVATWQSRRKDGRRLPARKDLDFYDFVGWLGQIFIAKVERDPFDLRYTLWGTTLTRWWGIDYTNNTLGEASVEPALWHRVELQYFAEMDRAPFIGIASGYLTQHNRSFIKVLGIDLPLSDGDGLSHVLSVHHRIDVEDSARQLLPDCPITEFVAG
ncbi:MAG: PAS domain-containing protein [Alphaproteobacteria bacterium]